MTTNDLTLWIQAGAVVAAVAAAIVALVVSSLDRQNTRQIAASDREAARSLSAEDRTASLRQSQLLFEQETLLRLLENARHGGSTDDLKRADLGAEAGALIGLFGPDRLPLNWANRVAKTSEELEAFAADESKQPFLRYAVEVQLALEEVTTQIRELLEPSHQL
ncbi:hypothetical protein KIV56_04555 [Cryobacterium breve]|uniref:Uncharacterized protein n=1 Tax=Cryobacterium breve TaxID=1259258 RepID=A0ABY7NDV1_9MICO|nr:hypothetical protein [Cryobacterium breve]WBM80674.1 hypothetical protein KIV56_04555 [Cryobacterium breve]